MNYPKPKLLLVLIFNLFAFTCIYSCDKPDKLEGTVWESDDFDIKPFRQEYGYAISKIQIEISFIKAQRAYHKVRIFEIHDYILDVTEIVDYEFIASS